MSTKDAILSTAMLLYAEKGYEGMTMKEIATRIGVTPPAVYAYFESKEDLFLQICKGFLHEHFQVAFTHTEAAQHLTAKQQLEQMLRGIFEFQINQPISIKVFFRLLLFPPEIVAKDTLHELLDLEDREIEVFSAIFDKGIKDGEIRDGNYRMYAYSLLCLMDGLFWQMQRLDEVQFWQRFDLVWEQFWKGIEKGAS